MASIWDDDNVIAGKVRKLASGNLMGRTLNFQYKLIHVFKSWP